MGGASSPPCGWSGGAGARARLPCELAGGPGKAGLQWLKAQHTTAYSPGSNITSQLTNFLTARLLWASRRPRLRRPPLPKDARNTRTHRSRRWLSTESARLRPGHEGGQRRGPSAPLRPPHGPAPSSPSRPTPAAHRPHPPAALLEEGELQGRTLQHRERSYPHRPAGRAGKAALHTRLLPVRVHLADVHGVEVPRQ